jgi:hypothetical protein
MAIGTNASLRSKNASKLEAEDQAVVIAAIDSEKND